MWKTNNKCVFAAGIGINLLVYYLATNWNYINVINGNGKGGVLDEINTYELNDWMYFTSTDVFLDNSTGDYYTFK